MNRNKKLKKRSHYQVGKKVEPKKRTKQKKNSVVLPEFEILRFHQLSVAIVVLIKKTTKSKRKIHVEEATFILRKEIVLNNI